jgi:hypothetical protein
MLDIDPPLIVTLQDPGKLCPKVLQVLWISKTLELHCSLFLRLFFSRRPQCIYITWEFNDCYTIPKMFTNNYKGMGICCLCICCKFPPCRPRFFSPSELLKFNLTNSFEILPQWSPGHRIKGSFLSFITKSQLVVDLCPT